MLAPFIKHLKMTELTDRSMYDHTITGIIMCEVSVHGWPKHLRGKSGDKTGWRSGCADKRKWLAFYLDDP